LQNENASAATLRVASSETGKHQTNHNLKTLACFLLHSTDKSNRRHLMAQFGIKLQIDGVESCVVTPTAPQVCWHSFEQQAGFCCYQLADWQLFVWGDCAMRSHDSLIIQALVLQQPIAIFGRSWVALHRQHPSVQGATDQLGLFPLLLLQQQQQYYICSDRHILTQLLGHTPTLCREAMQQLLCFGQILDDRSIIQDAVHLDAARYFSLQNGQLEMQTLPRRQPLCETHNSTVPQAIEAFVEAVRQSLHHAVNPMLSLSGGLDSRLILAATLALGRKLPALSYGQPDSADSSIARQLAACADLSLFTGRDIGNVWQISRRISQIGVGEVPLHHAHALVDDNLLAQTKDSTLLTGTGAEAFRAFYYDRGMPGFEFFDQHWLQPYCWPLIQRYIREEFFRVAGHIFRAIPQLESRLMPIFEQKLSSLLNPDLDCARAADQFYLDVRVRRMVVAGQQLLDPYYQRSHPFLAPDVLRTLGGLPARYKVASRFHREAISKLAPKLAAIPWDKTGQPLLQGLTFADRYPGLARRFGLSARYGKHSGPMFDYQHSGHLPYEHVLDRVLSYIGIDDEKERRQHIWQLLDSKALLHVKGLAEVWSHLLPQQPQYAGGVQ